MRKFPVLQNGDRTVVEATAIIEHLAVHRSWRPTPCGQRENAMPYGVADAKRMLDTAYAWLDERLAGRD